MVKRSKWKYAVAFAAALLCMQMTTVFAAEGLTAGGSGADSQDAASEILANEEAEVVKTGNCGADGTNVVWTFYSDGTLVFSGTGDMSHGYPSWSTYQEQVVKVVVEDGVTSCYPSCENYTELTTVEIADTVTSIGRYSFLNCENLVNLTIPDALTDISDYAFSGCTGLADEDGFVIVNHILFDYLGEAAAVTIPDGVTRIAAEAFYWNEAMTSVNIPDSVTVIGGHAFMGCYNLDAIEIPNSVTYIGHGAFSCCFGLTSVTVPGSVKMIGIASINDYDYEDDGGAFAACTSLTSVVLEEGVETIGMLTFFNCPNLTEVSIPSSVTTVGEHAFRMCTALTDITIPAGVTTMGYGAFENCTGLTSITFEGDAPEFLETCSNGDNWQESYNTFEGVTATAYYPEGNTTWTEDVMQDYCGTITWMPYALVSEPYSITDQLGDAIADAVDAISAGTRTVQQIVFNGDYAGEVVATADEDATGDKVLLLQLAAGETGSESGTLTLTDSSMISETGEITFTVTDSADGVLVYGINGDATGDNKVDASDTLAILRGVSGRTSLDAVQEGFADVNLDGTVNSNDLLAVVKYVSGRTSALN